MPYNYTHYFADVRGWTKVSLSLPVPAAWNDGDVINIGSPFGKSFIFRLSSTLFYDNQFSGTVYSAVAPTSSASFPRQHPKLGTGNFSTGSNGQAFGYYGAESPALSGTIRDNIPGTRQFMVLDEDLTQYITSGTVLYNTNHYDVAPTTNLTASWVNVPGIFKSGTYYYENAYVEIITDNKTRSIIYSFGGRQSDPAKYSTDIFWLSCSVNPSDALKLNISPWYRQDANKNSWPGSVPGNAFPSPATGSALTIPVVQGISDGALCYDSSTKTLYYSGGVKPTYSGSSAVISGSDEIFGWNVDGATGLITGSYFRAGTLPVGRYGHKAIAANGFLYVVGGASGTSYNITIDRALINHDGTVSNWEQSEFELPQGLNVVGTGSGLMRGAAFIYPFNPASSEEKHIYIVGGYKQYLTSTAPGYVNHNSGQVYSAKMNFVQGASRLSDANKIEIDPAWQGPASGEMMTPGAQLGPNDIRPVLPLLDNIYQQMIVSTTPSG
jgi:hypothetical protein